MTIRPYLYGTATNGTHATVVNGSDIVTGVGGTSFTGISFTDWFSMGGVSVPVLETVDDAHLRLAYVWPGTNITAGSYTITAGIDSTDARRYGWFVAQYYQRLADIPADVQTFRDQAIAAAADSSAFATASGVSAALSLAWASTPYNTDVTSPGTRSSLHYSVVSANAATLATSNGAAQVALAAAQVAVAAAWSSAGVGVDVTTPGTRSALHYSAQASTTYNNAVTVYNNTVGVQTTIQGYLATAAQNVALAADWAQKAIGADVNGPGTRSSYHWSTISQGWSNTASSFATNSAASASAAAASAALLANPDFGFITDSPTDFQDWGTVP